MTWKAAADVIDFAVAEAHGAIFKNVACAQVGRGPKMSTERDWSGAGVGWAHADKVRVLNNAAVTDDRKRCLAVFIGQGVAVVMRLDAL